MPDLQEPIPACGASQAHRVAHITPSLSHAPTTTVGVLSVRIALFMGLDAREAFNLDPAVAISRAVQDHYDCITPVPFELDRTGPLYKQLRVPNHRFGLGAQVARKRAIGRPSRMFTVHSKTTGWWATEA